MISRFKDYFQDKKVFITGNTGFKGSWLCKWLLNLDSNIIGLSNEIPTNPSLFEILDLKSNITHIKGDIRDYNKLNDVIINHNPDIIIHLAAQPLVRKSYAEPVETYQTNVMGTVNLLESIRKLKDSKKNHDKVILNVTTDKCYENKEQDHAYKEGDPLGGYDPYSSSKACSELVTSAYKRSFFNCSDKNDANIAISTARAGNVIGGGDWSDDRLVVDCINSLVNNKPIILRNPKALRPWQHVLEGISGYLTLICHMHDNISNKINNNVFNYKSANNSDFSMDYSSSWNFGPNDKDIVDVETLVKKLILNWGHGDYTIESNDKLHEANLLKLNIGKSLSYLEWRPLLNFDESIDITSSWYKEYYSNSGNMIDFTDKQIKEYIKKV